MDKNDFAGIEVSKDELLVALRREEQTLPLQSFPNTGEGHRALVRYLARQSRVVRACLESTGVYGLDLALLLQKQAGVEVMVANPRAVRLALAGSGRPAVGGRRRTRSSRALFGQFGPQKNAHQQGRQSALAPRPL